MVEIFSLSLIETGFQRIHEILMSESLDYSSARLPVFCSTVKMHLTMSNPSMNQEYEII